jgi:hypothetical protein
MPNIHCTDTINTTDGDTSQRLPHVYSSSSTSPSSTPSSSGAPPIGGSLHIYSMTLWRSARVATFCVFLVPAMFPDPWLPLCPGGIATICQVWLRSSASGVVARQPALRYSCLARTSAEQRKCDNAHHSLPLLVWRAAISPMAAYSNCT